MRLNSTHHYLLTTLATIFCICASVAHGQENPAPAQIAEWRKAAEQGHAAAQSALGWCYRNGQGVVKNEAEAVKWYRKAAEQGDVEAQYNLGDCYFNGHGVAKDAAEAARLWHKAAEHGYAAAQSNLGACYDNGQGVVKNEIEGYKWALLAAARGFEIAKRNASNHEKRLSPAQRAEGRRLAQEWEAAYANLGGDDLAKRKEIERLLELIGMSKIMEEMLDQMLTNLKNKENLGIPEEFWTRFRKSADIRELINLMVPIYDKHYTMEDLKVMNAFYSSDAGKRMLATMPQAMNEGVQVGQKWGEALAAKVAAELEKEKAAGRVRKYNPADGTIE